MTVKTIGDVRRERHLVLLGALYQAERTAKGAELIIIAQGIDAVRSCINNGYLQPDQEEINRRCRIAQRTIGFTWPTL
jgi:hypothetical protein